MNNKKIWDKEPLGKVFRSITSGCSRARLPVIALARTARTIDPSCPYGAHGVLEDLQKCKLSPPEISKLYRLCRLDPLRMNAVIYATYREELSSDHLKQAIRCNFRGFNVQKILENTKRYDRHFGQYQCG